MSKLFQVDANVWKQAAHMFGRTEQTLEEDVATIKKWFKTQLHLPEIMEDVKIRNFLLLNKCSVEKTKQSIDMYYTIRTVIPDLYEKSNPKTAPMKEFLKNTYYCLSPNLFKGLYRVYFYKLKTPNKYSAKETAMQIANYSEIRLYEDCMVGDIWIIDTTNSTLQDMMATTPSIMAKTVTMYQKVFSFRIKAAYFINSPTYISVLVNLLKSVLKPKIFARVQVFKDAKILQEIFAKEDLPKDYGGCGSSLDELQESINLKLDEYQDRFDLLDKLKVDESLRPEILDNDEILGFYGNFKNLSVD